ncbi:hypothetical protein B0A49_10676 [Cryomyces minteri]|uniref:Pentacotripeptide-repeat region of PRORP domain-containing protein n=1 Tax=Cryomyces minteri TaxID=331657 RepID=A0A4U0WG39_9PEZI|nr:hypothetical protein B0A49_10676 [Cryomyces minteri]
MLIGAGDERPFSVSSSQHTWSRLKRRLRHASTVLEHYRREEHTPEGKLKYYEKRLLDLKERLRVMRAALGSANSQHVQPSRIRKYYGVPLEVRKISGTNVTKRTKTPSDRLTGGRTRRAYREILTDIQRTAETTYSMSRLAIRRQDMQSNVTTSTQYQRLQTWGQEMEEVMAQVTQVDHVEESKSQHESPRSRTTREPDAASECSLLLAPRKPVLLSTQHLNQRAFSNLAAQAQIASTTRRRDPEGVAYDHEAETRDVPAQPRGVEVGPRRVRDMRKRRNFLLEFKPPRDAKTVEATDDDCKDAKIDRARRAADRWEAMIARPGLRTKYVRISSVKDVVTNDNTLDGKDASTVSIPDEFSSLWNETFALLNAKYDARVQDALPTTTEQELDPRVDEWVEALLQDGHGVVAMRVAYEKIELSQKQTYWNNVMLWLLRHSPNIALQFLAATNIRPYQPGFRVAEALEYLVDHDFHNAPTEGLDMTVDNHDALLSLACSLMQRKSEMAPPITQRTIYVLLLRCREEQARLLHHTLVSNGVYLHWNTLLHFASSFVKTGHYESALDVLKDAASRAYHNEQGNVDVNSQAFLSVCAAVLRRSAAEEGGYHSSSRIIATLMEMGVQLNVQLYSIVILNAVEAGDFNTAFRIFDLLKANKVEPNHFTYAILLKGWRESRDPEALHVIIEDAKSTLGDRIDAILATEILHCLYLHHKDHNPSSYFAVLLQAYREFFDLRTLARLGIVSPDYSATFSQPSQSKKMQPLPATLGIMLVSELQSPTGDRDEKERELLQLYANFRQSVEQGYPAIGVLAETDHTYNAFLMAFGRHVRLLSHLPQIVRDMTLPLPPTARVRTHGKTTRPIQPCQPTVQTFSILMESFAYHDQVVAAEKVLELMQQRGVEPNQVTWNTLITGYARTQDINGTVHAMKRMEMQKLDMDQWTLEGIGKIRDREALMTALGRQGRAGLEGSDKSGDGDASQKTLEDTKERWTALGRDVKDDGTFSPLPENVVMASS